MTQKKLRNGFTTGTAAAAAVKGALSCILSGKQPSAVTIPFLSEGRVTIPVFSMKVISDTSASCTVIKDAGDDPDITHHAEIGATVTFTQNTENALPDILIKGGAGVGQVTKPGLEILPGNPAINSGPQKMIRQAVQDVLQEYNQKGSVEVEIFVPEGERLSEKTLNKRLGILGGISILGTTGIVKAMSHESYVATIEASLNVARAAGLKTVVLTTGRRSERFSQTHFSDLPEESFIQIGDFFKISLEYAGGMGFKTIILAVFFGKAVKMAMGVPHTHAARSELCLNQLASWVWAETRDTRMAEMILQANTARQAFDLLEENRYHSVITYVGRRMVDQARQFLKEPVSIQSVIFNFDGNVSHNSTPEGNAA